MDHGDVGRGMVRLGTARNVGRVGSMPNVDYRYDKKYIQIMERRANNVICARFRERMNRDRMTRAVMQSLVRDDDRVRICDTIHKYEAVSLAYRNVIERCDPEAM